MVKKKFDTMSAFPAGFGGWSFSLNDKNTWKIMEKTSRQKKQCKEFVRWVNHHLNGGKVSNLDKDFRDGVVFANLIHAISGRRVDGVDGSRDAISNMTSVLNFLQHHHVCMHPLSAHDLVAGDTRATMRLVLAVAAHYHPSHIVPRKDQDKDETTCSEKLNKRNKIKSAANKKTDPASAPYRHNNKPQNVNDDNGNNNDDTIPDNDTSRNNKKNNKVGDDISGFNDYNDSHDGDDHLDHHNDNAGGDNDVGGDDDYAVDEDDGGDDDDVGKQGKLHKGILEEVAQLKSNTQALMLLLSEQLDSSKMKTHELGGEEERGKEKESLKIVFNLNAASALTDSLSSHGLCLKNIKDMLTSGSGRCYVQERSGHHCTKTQLTSEDEIVKFEGKTINIWLDDSES